jgi:hypothetical protein
LIASISAEIPKAIPILPSEGSLAGVGQLSYRQLNKL